MADPVETAAYRLRTPVDLPTLLGGFHQFNVPEHWPNILRQAYEHGGRAFDPAWNLKVGGVNRAIRALVPDVLYTGHLPYNAPKTWLFARSPVDAGLLKRILQAHLQERLVDKSGLGTLREAVRALDVASHADDWEAAAIDPDWLRSNPAGTPIMAPVLYRLIPEIIAERIAQLGKFDEELSFVQVATDEGAELVSWPPIAHESGRGRTARISHYSAVLTIALRTVPFDPAPRLHLGVKTRRWVTSGKLFLPPGMSTRVYVRPLADPATGFGGTRLAVPSLRWSKSARDYVWSSNGPAGVLDTLTLGGKFPDAARIKNDPGAYVPSGTGLQAMVTFHTRMGSHPVNTGVMPDERRRILTWAAQTLPDGFDPLLVLERVKSRAIERQYLEPTPVPKEPQVPQRKHAEEDASAEQKHADELSDYERKRVEWEAKYLQAVAKRASADEENSRRRRALLAHGMQGEELRVDVITDTDAVRQAIVGAASQWLGLVPDDAASTSNQVIFLDGELRLRFVCHVAGPLTSPLGDGTVPARGAAHRDAVDERATMVREYLDSQALTSELVLAEILGPEHYSGAEQRADPYDAVRQGAARAGRVTQFITTGGEASLDFRAQAAWEDGLRSLGISLVPPHSDGLDLPENIDQVAFWVVRRNATRSVSRAVWQPIAVTVRPDQHRVMARTDESDGWIPYNRLLCELATAEPRSSELGSEQKQREQLARFVRRTLPSLKGRPLLLLTEAGNLRSRWKWLTDEGLEKDRISIGEPTTTRLASYNKHLRVVRVRTEGGRLETPMWWVPATEASPSGFTKALLRDEGSGASGRVFYSLAEKSGKLNTHNMRLRKFTRAGSTAPSPNKAAPVPRMVEITVAGLSPTDSVDAAEAWAMFVHQQRFTADYREGRELPYALDLCSRASDYAFPESTLVDEDDAPPTLENAPGALGTSL
jgi:hypothetical protein